MLVLFITGTTSACAENTLVGFAPAPRGWNYLRVRGEYEAATAFGREAVELPPRARRIHPIGFAYDQKGGTTSACAENTMIRFSMLTDLGNYLRVRGEYS